ncbi:MAG: nuclear transport factor 2 family protein [Zetaproteobacteria bacterium]|nr:MAG: nuclear transport factor 2 family protein [Zetaproteobacteria bacterium]
MVMVICNKIAQVPADEAPKHPKLNHPLHHPTKESRCSRKKTAMHFATEWEAAWNSHDIDQIIRHYADDIVLVSPIADKLLGTPEVAGVQSVRAYFMKGLEAYPNLEFKVIDVLHGVNTYRDQLHQPERHQGK